MFEWSMCINLHYGIYDLLFSHQDNFLHMIHCHEMKSNYKIYVSKFRLPHIINSFINSSFPAFIQTLVHCPFLNFFFSSPEHNYSRRAFRVVMCPSSIINNFFKYLLLPNRWANLDQTWQKCSLGSLLQKMFTEFD